jgi:hypothetical protein
MSSSMSLESTPSSTQSETTFEAEPLSLIDLCKVRIKGSVKKLDRELIDRLNLPNHLQRLLAKELAYGFGQSFARLQMRQNLE